MAAAARAGGRARPGGGVGWGGCLGPAVPRSEGDGPGRAGPAGHPRRAGLRGGAGCGGASPRPPPPARFGPSPPRGADLRRKRALLGCRALRHGGCSTEREALPPPRRGGGGFGRPRPFVSGAGPARGTQGGRRPRSGRRPPGRSGRAPLCAALPRAGVAQERAAVTAAATSASRASGAPGRRALVQPARDALPRRRACSGSGAASAPLCGERATSPWRSSGAGPSGRLGCSSAAAGAPGGAWKGLGGPQVFSALSSARFGRASVVFALLCLVIFLYFFLVESSQRLL